MKDLSPTAKGYILAIILAGLGLTGWMALNLDWANTGLYLLAALGAVAQTLKVEGPNARTNYSIAWFVYGFTYVAYGPAEAFFVILVAHLVEWYWHKYPWFIQGFNIGAHLLPAFLAGLTFGMINQGSKALDLNFASGLLAASLVFVFGNHFLVGLVVRLARGQSFAESGVFEPLTLLLDFTVVMLGAATVQFWAYNPFLVALNIPLLYPLYRAFGIPALQRQSNELKNIGARTRAETTGD